MKTKLNLKKGTRLSRLVRNKPVKFVFAALALGLFFGVAAIAITSSTARATTGACTIPGTNYGTDTLTVTAPATGTLNIWSRVQTPTASNPQFMLQVTDMTASPNTSNCFNTVGIGGSSIPTNTWTWTDQNGSSSSLTQITANSGDQLQLEYVGLQQGAALDNVLITSDGGACTPQSASGSPCVSVANAISLPFNMAAGVSQGFTDSAGTVWQKDQYFTQDNTYGSTGGVSPGGDGSACSTTLPNSNCTLHAIAGTNAQLVYQDERWGDFHYDFPANPGTYSVTLKLAEINPSSGGRSFNVTADGNTVLSNFTPAPNYTADDQTFQVTVPSSGTFANDLNLTFITNTNSASLSGIVITSTAPPTISITSPTSGSPVSGSNVSLGVALGNTSGTTSVTYSLSNGTTIGTATTSPYSYSWNSTSVADGSYTLTASVTSNGQTVSTSEPITVSNNTCTTAPNPPTGQPSTSGVTASNVTVNWSAATPGTNCTIAGYNVYRSTSQNGTYTKVNPSTVSGTSYSDSTVAANTTYYYEVTTLYQSSTSNTESTKSTVSAAVTTSQNCSASSGQPTTPGTPTVVAGGTSYTQISFNWTASTDSNGCTLSGYHIYRNGTMINTVNSPSYTDTGSDLAASYLQSGTAYNYYVQAYDSGGNTSQNSTTASLSTQKDNVAPSIPTGLTATNVGSTSLTLSWNASTDLPNPGATGIGGYYIYENDSANPTFTSNGTGTTYNVTNLSPGVTYKFAIEAFDKASPPNASVETSDISTSTTGTSCTSAPTVPTNLTSSSQTQTSITLSWGASTAPAGCTLEGYQIFRNHVALSVLATSTTYTDSGLTTGTYTYSVAAIDSNGPPSANTADQSFSTAPDTTPPSTPTNFKAVAPVAGQVELTWTPSSDNVGVQDYVISRSGGAPFTAVQLNGANASSYLDSSTAASTSYTYTIKAYDYAGNPSNGATANVTTPSGGTTNTPPPPTGLQSLLITSNFVDVTWNPSAGATSYTVYRNGTAIATGITATSYGDSGLNDNTTYTYTVTAVNSAGSSAQTGGLTVQTLLSPTTSLIGDITGPLGKPDGQVNVFDLAVLLANYNQASMTYSQGDLNGDGTVNVFDLGIMLSNWTGN